MIRITDLHKRLGPDPVLLGVDLEVAAGEVVALVGPSGTGKSVLLKHVIGLLVPDRGDVVVDGRSVARASHRELSRLRQDMGYVFQDAALLDSLTVRENLRLALDDDACARDPDHAADRIDRALRWVNLDDGVLARYPGALSGGMRKRVGVARAILNGPGVLLYDEPTTGLDPQNVAAINALILRARDEFGATSLVVTHDMGSIEEIADRVALLMDGRVRFSGPAAAFFESTEPEVREFIGRATTRPDQEMRKWPAIDAVAAN